MLPLNTATCLLNKKAQFTGGGRVFGTDTLTALQVAEAYRKALRSDDPGKYRRPTEAAAEALGYSRGHISRMLTQARRDGMPEIGPMRAPRAHELARDALPATP